MAASKTSVKPSVNLDQWADGAAPDLPVSTGSQADLLGRPRHDQQGNRPAAGYQHHDGEDPSAAYLQQAEGRAPHAAAAQLTPGTSRLGGLHRMPS